jgi:hypothetical protein
LPASRPNGGEEHQATPTSTSDLLHRKERHDGPRPDRPLGPPRTETSPPSPLGSAARSSAPMTMATTRLAEEPQ